MVAGIGDASVDGATPDSPESLLDLEVGATARIVGIDGDRVLIRRFLALGLRRGTELTVAQLRGRGLVVLCGGTRVALGPEMVHNIRIEQVA